MHERLGLHALSVLPDWPDTSFRPRVGHINQQSRSSPLDWPASFPPSTQATFTTSQMQPDAAARHLRNYFTMTDYWRYHLLAVISSIPRSFMCLLSRFSSTHGFLITLLRFSLLYCLLTLFCCSDNFLYFLAFKSSPLASYGSAPLADE